VSTFFSVFFYILQHFRCFPLLGTAILHHTFRKLPPRQAQKVGSKLRNRADHVIMPVNQSSSFRKLLSAFPQITHTRSAVSCGFQSYPQNILKDGKHAV